MKIELKNITVRELVEDYEDNDELGVRGYGGRLDIRPPYQREFVYKDKQRDAVIDTVTKNFPLNVMYWAVVDAPGDDGIEYEVIDGQQRTISVCQYVDGDFAFKGRYFHNLQSDEQEQILDYELAIYLCTGTDSEKLEWFETINIAGEKLTDQELRNAVYHGSWLTDAKKYFSKSGCPAYAIGSDYVSGSPIRQEYLEKALRWISGGDINEYMAKNQHKAKATSLWTYFQSVITWVQETFPITRSEMKTVEWGPLYDKHKDDDLDPKELEERIVALMVDDDVTNNRGIFPYVLNGDVRQLSIRKFSDAERRAAYERQEGLCFQGKQCITVGNEDGQKRFEITEMDADHITPWSKGGKTSAANCQMLCVACNRSKGAR